MREYKLDTRVNSKGYNVLVTTARNGYDIYEHVLIAERVMGKPLPKDVLVHHANEDRSDNKNSNLVVCPDTAYHSLIHKRLEAKKACGDPNWRKCRLCQRYDDTKNMAVHADRYRHKACIAKADSERYYRRKKERDNLNTQ